MTILERSDPTRGVHGGRIQGESAQLGLLNYGDQSTPGKLDLHVYGRDDEGAAFVGEFDLADVAEILNRIPGFTASYVKPEPTAHELLEAVPVGAVIRGTGVWESRYLRTPRGYWSMDSGKEHSIDQFGKTYKFQVVYSPEAERTNND